MKKNIRVLALLTFIPFLGINCKGKTTEVQQQKNNKEMKANSIEINLDSVFPREAEAMKRRFELQMSDDDDYAATGEDVILGGKIACKVFRDAGVKPISEAVFKEKVNHFFSIKLDDNLHPKNNKYVYDHETYFVRMKPSSDGSLILEPDMEFAYGGYSHYFFFKDEHLMTPLLPWMWKYFVYINRYIFNDDQSGLMWLLFHGKGFLEDLVRIFGFDKEPKINKVVLRTIYDRYRVVHEDYAPAAENLDNLFAARDSEGKLQIREGLLKQVAESYVNDDTKFYDKSEMSDKRVFYTIMDDYCNALLSDNMTEKDNYKTVFSFEERCHIFAAILNVMHTCSQMAGGLHNHTPESIYQEPNVVETIVAHDYFGYPNLKDYFQYLHNELQETEAEAELRREEERQQEKESIIIDSIIVNNKPAKKANKWVIIG